MAQAETSTGNKLAQKTIATFFKASSKEIKLVKENIAPIVNSKSELAEIIPLKEAKYDHQKNYLADDDKQKSSKRKRDENENSSFTEDGIDEDTENNDQILESQMLEKPKLKRLCKGKDKAFNSINEVKQIPKTDVADIYETPKKPIPKALSPKKEVSVVTQSVNEKKSQLTNFFKTNSATISSAPTINASINVPLPDSTTDKIKTREASQESVKSSDFDIATVALKKGEKVPYLLLAKTFHDIEQISSRLKIAEILTNFFRVVIALTPEDLLPCIYLCVNKLAPDFNGIELGIGDSILQAAVADSTGRTLAIVKALYEERGDLGVVAQESRTTQRTLFVPKHLYVRDVFNSLRAIALEQGTASTNRKKDLIKLLLVAARDCEAMYIIRSLQGKLRIGLQERTVLTALGHAMQLSHLSDVKGKPTEEDMQRAVDIVKFTYCELPSYDLIIPTLLEVGLKHLREKCFLTPGIPLKPMLAKPTKGFSEIFDRLGKKAFTCEFKYDGERAQIHYSKKDGIHIFSRNSEDNTGKYPDIIAMLPSHIQNNVESFVIDCEAVAFDREQGKILPFQVLSHRARKSVAFEDIKVQVCLFTFDILYLNGQTCLQKPLIERRKLLYESLKEETGFLQFAQHINVERSNSEEEAADVTSQETLHKFLTMAVTSNCEGLMVKTLEEDATYEASRRSLNWLKVKKDYLEGIGDTLDLVPIGAYLGRGKRTGVYGAYLLACYDSDNDAYQSICKIGTGFSDASLEQHAEFFKDKVIGDPKSYYESGMKPDVWLEPCQVWEVLAADLSISPVHKAASGLVSAKGIALRFPRFIRIRDDKNIEDATTAIQVADMYKNQNLNVQSGGNVDDDFY